MTKEERADERAWFEEEAEASRFPDARLRKRFGMVLERLWSGIGQTIPFACEDWSSTRAAYRFLSNQRVSEQAILSDHFHASAERFKSTQGPILILQDTTTFSYQRERPELIATQERWPSSVKKMARGRRQLSWPVVLPHGIMLLPANCHRRIVCW
ncbi:hypothetical protein BZM26_33435 [Paraburkholderia strydomiana]|nr:hypothetical protein BZM26_33435 [Paraburkholderia strydomiana]